MCKLRISAHTLQIERGRYNNIKVTDRKCPVCQDQEVEDEVHFLLQCKCYSSIRKDFFEKLNLCNNVHSDKQTLIHILTMTDKTMLQEIGKYIHTFFKLREEALTQTSIHKI